MKKQDVPQDLYYFKDNVIRDLMYAVDENGQYTPVVSDGWSVKNDALGAVWDDIREECEKIHRRVLTKEIRPLAYHLKKSLQNVRLLSAYSGVPKRRKRKHLKYDEFMKSDAITLQKYADAMRITVEELKRVDEWN
jgi:transposase-like protein